MTDFAISRRELLSRCGLGIGSLAVAAMLHADRAPSFGSDSSGPRPRAKRIIQLMQTGGPSQMDLFDPKPELQRRGGQKSPLDVEKFLGGNTDELLASPFKFAKHGRAGMEFSELLPEMATLADQFCMVRSMSTEHNNHTEATVMINTGKTSMGRPSLGSWISYAIGSENHNLPSFVVLRDPKKYDTAGSLSWSSGWLPATHQGTEFNSQGPAVPNLFPKKARPVDAERANLEFLAQMNEAHRQRYPRESELEARIKNYELAGRMQVAAGEALNIAAEPESVRQLYGLNNPASAAYGTRCLMARRLVEAGVRFVQVYPDQEGQAWDSHSKLPTDLPRMCRMTDHATAGLLRDLAQRGLLEETIVLWAGEFGRLPTSQNADGRDHNRNAFSLLVAGGGFRGGLTYGKTDDFGYKAVADRVSVPDLHATILHQLGIDHQSLTFRHHGRDETLTDAPATGARVVKELLT